MTDWQPSSLAVQARNTRPWSLGPDYRPMTQTYHAIGSQGTVIGEELEAITAAVTWEDIFSWL